MSTTHHSPAVNQVEKEPLLDEIIAGVRAVCSEDQFPPGDRIAQDVRDAWERFQSDLPSLLEEFSGQWVAYSAHERLGRSDRPAELYDACFDRGLKIDQFIVCPIEPIREFDDVV